MATKESLVGAELSNLAGKEQQRGTAQGTSRVYSFNGVSVLVFGDPHLSGIFKGSHRDYRSNCVHNIKQWMGHVQGEISKGNRVVVIFLGDIIGVKERHLVRDNNFRNYVYRFFKELNNMAEMVCSVRGNHDFGVDDPEFLILETLDLIVNPKYIDIYNPQGTAHELRLHFVNYGNARSIEFDLDTPEGVTHIALGHNDYQVPGRNDFYGTSDNTIDLSTLSNFKGIDYVVFGDIHHPFDGLEEFTLSVEPSKVLYAYCPGSPARTSASEDFDDCFYLGLRWEEGHGQGTAGGYSMFIENFGARKPNEVFLEKNNFAALEELADEEVAEESKEQRDRLSRLINEINSTNLHLGDPRSQILDRSALNPRAAKIALETYDSVLAGATIK